MTLTKDQILESSDLTTEAVAVSEWGGDVLVRTMTGTDRDAFEDSLFSIGADGKATRDVSNLAVKLLAMTIVDDAGNRLFGPADIAMLGRKSAAAIARVYAVASRLNGIGAKAEGDAAKNSVAAPSGDSTSA
jgi:hypothetical protein